MAKGDCLWCRRGNRCPYMNCWIDSCKKCVDYVACREEHEIICKLADKMERVNPISPAELRAALKRAEEMKEGNIDDG